MDRLRPILLVFLLFGCISPHATTEASRESVLAGLTQKPDIEKQSAEPGEEATKDESEKKQLQEQAEDFDRFLQGKLSVEENAKIKNSCNDTPEKNPFCFSILNYPYFTEKKAKLKKAENAPSRRIKRVNPTYRKGELSNWTALRLAPPAATISPMAGLRKARFSHLKELALRETECPLFIAISIAAALEDQLPKQDFLGDIARLYEKGGNCIPEETPDDKATTLTRAGLFQLLDNKPQKAYELFVRASDVPNAVNSRPLYWRHRMEKLLGKTRDAEKSLKQLSDKYPFSFHTVVAQAAINADPGALLSQPHRDAKRSQLVPAINLLIEQVEILHRYGLENSARTVLDWAVGESKDVEPEVKIYLAELKDQKSEDHLKKIKLLADVLYDHPNLISKKSMELYFPKPYFPVFEKHSSGLDPFLLLAIARQESAFNPHAVSSANAVGLLQVVPSTGKKVTNASRRALMKPETNIKTGSKYFQQLLKKVGGQIHLAMAAYNAGPRKLREWLNRYPTEDPILFIDILPYRETRDYVALVLRNYYWYRRMHGNEQEAREISKRVFDLQN
ncbi:MAG: lytic transglycosylase domain-containing protein [Bdellovibrionota bacterium]